MWFSTSPDIAADLPLSRVAGQPFDRIARRPRFAPPTTVFGVGAVSLLMLAILLPRPDIFMQSVMHGDLRDHVVEQYLWNLLRAQPHDNNLRLRLAEQRVALQKFNSGVYLLQPLLDGNDVEWKRKASRLAVEALEQQFYAELPGTEQRKTLGDLLRTQLQWLLSNENNPALLERLSTKALALGEPVLAARIYQRVAGMGERLPEWYAEAGRIALAAGDYVVSAQFYAQAQSRATSMELRQQFTLSAIESLVAGDRVDDAVALAAQMEGALGVNPEFHGYLVRLYAQSRASPARTMLRTRLRDSIIEGLTAESSPGVLERLLSQAETLGDARLTLQVLTRAAETNPNRNPQWYEKAARLALSQSEYRLSARFYWAARHQATETDQQRSYYLAGLRSLQAGNLLAETLGDAEKELGDLEDDRDTLYVLAKLALAAQRLDLAERYAKRLLRPDA